MFKPQQLLPYADVIVLDSEGTLLGEMKFKDAKRLAESQSLDLIPINKQNNKDVCKIMDFGKWKYEQKKKEKNKKKISPITKEMQFGLNIADHDLNIKMNHIKEFLSKGHSVKLTLSMEGREKHRPELAFEKMNVLIQSLADISKNEPVKRNGSTISCMIHALKGKTDAARQEN